MSIKSKVLAAAATLTLVGGVGALGAGSASAATPSCGPSCINVFSPLFGTHHNPGYVLDVLRQGEKVGQPVILFQASNFDPAEDFVVSYQGLVSDFFAAGLVSAAVNLHYGGGSTFPDGTKSADDPAFELEYAPFGVQSGLCVGTGSTALQGTKVALEPCGASSKTVWIADVGLVPGHPTTSVTTITCTGGKCTPTTTITLGTQAQLNAFLSDDPTALFHGYAPAINGSTTNFSHPTVLTYPAGGNPVDKPRPQLFTSNLTGFSNGFGPIVGTVSENQLWSAVPGVIGP